MAMSSSEKENLKFQKSQQLSQFWTYRHISPSDICPYQVDISCYWSYFHQTLNVGSWDYLEQISTVAVTFVQATFVLATFAHIKNIPTQFWPNFLGPMLGLIFLDQNFYWTKILLTQTFLDLYFFGPKILLDPKFLWTQNFSDSKFCGRKILWSLNFFNLNFS